MIFEKTNIDGVFVITPNFIGDSRGYFVERYRKELFDKEIGKVDFIQDNQSLSSRGVLRGLHYQKGDFSQAKMVWVLSGKVIDVAVDLRKESPTFGKYVMVELSDENKKMLFIPRGFAHGFLVISESATFAYKVDNIYAPKEEITISFDDKDLDIKWPIEGMNIIMSEKDKNGIKFIDAEYF